MTVSEIRNIITHRGIQLNLKGKKKADLIHIIQRDENNYDCYSTSYSETCGQDGCLWRSDCLKADKVIN
ncbi:MAG: SAP domain-containing protein [SAR324 cluster bacterium]|nr:SAP domain-containing protein [SAR324 cluster bacterium]